MSLWMDGWNPPPSGGIGSYLWSWATLPVYNARYEVLSSWRAHEIWFESSPCVGSQISEAHSDWRSSNSRVRDVIRQIAIEHELGIISGKVAQDHVHILISYHPRQNLSAIVQSLKGISSRILLQEFHHLRKQFWGKHLWARGYFAVSSGTITDAMITQYIDSQEGEPLNDDSRFQIDS